VSEDLSVGDGCSVSGHISELDQSHGGEPGRGDVALLCSEAIMRVFVFCVCLVECFKLYETLRRKITCSCKIMVNFLISFGYYDYGR
jgi:hypothetical protein